VPARQIRPSQRRPRRLLATQSRRQRVLERGAIERHAGDVTRRGRLVVIEQSDNGNDAMQVRTCARPGCGNPLSPRQPKWCSRSGQKKVAHQRQRERLLVAPEVTNGEWRRPPGQRNTYRWPSRRA
jgi:hypothetical protein